MSVDREVEGLPEAGSAPLIIDAEFTEVEDKGLPTLDSVDEISTVRARSPLELPKSGPTPEGRARVCLLYTSPSPRDAHESRMPSSA